MQITVEFHIQEVFGSNQQEALRSWIHQQEGGFITSIGFGPDKSLGNPQQPTSLSYLAKIKRPKPPPTRCMLPTYSAPNHLKPSIPTSLGHMLPT